MAQHCPGCNGHHAGRYPYCEPCLDRWSAFRRRERGEGPLAARDRAQAVIAAPNIDDADLEDEFRVGQLSMLEVV